MAIIQEVVHVLDSKAFAHETHERSGGLHVSTIIHSIEEDMFGISKGEGMATDVLEQYRIIGFLFERALYDIVYKNQGLERFGEFEVDGIKLTPDAVNVSGTELRGVETKATFRSMKHDLMDQFGEFMTWWMQMKAYAKALCVLKWDLYVLYISGDYGRNRYPHLKHFEIEFSLEEVEENWTRILNHARWMRETGMLAQMGIEWRDHAN